MQPQSLQLADTICNFITPMNVSLKVNSLPIKNKKAVNLVNDISQITYYIPVIPFAGDHEDPGPRPARPQVRAPAHDEAVQAGHRQVGARTRHRAPLRGGGQEDCPR